MELVQMMAITTLMVMLMVLTRVETYKKNRAARLSASRRAFVKQPVVVAPKPIRTRTNYSSRGYDIEHFNKVMACRDEYLLSLAITA